MNTFQRILFTILAVVGLTTQVSSAFYVGGEDPDYFETETNMANITKEGTGITTLQNTRSITAINITNGTLAVDETADLGNAQVSFSTDNVTLEVTANSGTGFPSTINTGTLRLAANGTLKVDAACTAVLSANATRTMNTFTLTKTGTGTLLVNNDRHSSTAPITVSDGILEVVASGVLPTKAVTIGSTGTLLLEKSDAGTAPGATSINSGGTLKTSVAIPAVGVANTFSGGLTFHSGAILDLGGDWAQNITVAP